MCRTSHIDFYHNCGHVQRVDRPSTNPKCDEEEHTIWYRFRGDLHGSSGWCKRCYRSSLFASPAYGVEMSGPVCWYIMQRKEDVPKVKAMVTLGPIPFVNYDIDTLWDLRFQYMAIDNEFRNQYLWEAWNKQMDVEDEAHLTSIDRTHFFPLDSLQHPPDPMFYTTVTREGLAQLHFDAMPEPGSEEERCICQFAVPWEDVPEERACNGGPVAAVPCSHFFGMRCIRQLVEEQKITKCPTCRTEWKIKYEPTVLPYPGWAQALNRNLDERQNPVQWREKPLLEWFAGWEGRFARMLAYVFLAVFFTVLFTSRPWTSWWTISTLSVGTLVYVVATALPIKIVGELEMFAFNWASCLALFVWRTYVGSTAVAWRCAVALGLAAVFLVLQVVYLLRLFRWDGTVPLPVFW